MTNHPPRHASDSAGTASAPDMLAALRLGVEYDDLLRKYQGPAQVLFDGDMKEIDAAYDRWVAAARAAISKAEGRP